MMSGMRNDPPISTSSPRDTIAWPPRAAVDARRVDRLARRLHNERTRMLGEEGRYAGTGEQRIDGGQLTPRIGHEGGLEGGGGFGGCERGGPRREVSAATGLGTAKP